MNFKIIIAAMVALYTTAAFSQTDINRESDSLPLDQSITYGRLTNGFTYYLKNLDTLQKGVKMRFIVKVGRHYEKPHERDFSHLIEHIAFRESKNFPEGFSNNPTLLASLNMHKGNFQGQTGGQFTVYEIDIPNNNSRAIETGLRWFKDIATEVNMSEENIDNERGIMLQEHSSGDATRRITAPISNLSAQFFPCIKGENGYSDHLLNFPFKDIQEFYSKWYRPDLMSIFIVGNINKFAELEGDIIDRFSEISQHETPVTIPDCEKSYFLSPPKFSVISTKSLSQNELKESPVSISLFFRDKLTREDVKTWKGLKRIVLHNFLESILSQRMRNQTQSYNSHYKILPHHTYKDNFSPNALRILIEADRNYEKDALKEAIYLLNQLRSSGVSEEELEMVKQKYLRSHPLKQKETSSYWLRQFYKYIEKGEALPSDKLEIMRDWVEGLSVGDFNQFIDQAISEMPEDIGIINPEGHTTSLASEDLVRKVISTVFKEPVSPYKTPEIPSYLIEPAKTDSLKIVNYELEQNVENQYILNNGLRLKLIPTGPFPENQIFLHGFSPKGAQCFPKKDYSSAVYAPSIVRHAGVGDYNKFQLERFLGLTNSLRTGVSPYITSDETGIKGSSTTEEFEYFLQLIYLFFTEPRASEISFEDWKEKQVELALKNVAQNDFFDKRLEFIQDYSRLPHASGKVKEIKEVDFFMAYKIYHQLLSNAADFTFVITGDFEISAVLPLLQTYLGNLPSNPRNTFCQSNQWTAPSLPQGPVFLSTQAPDHYETQNSFYNFTFVRPQTPEDDWREEVRVELLGEVTNRIIGNFRREGFALYWFGGRGWYNRMMKRFEIGIQFTGIPEEQKIIRRKYKKVIDDIKNGRIPPEVLAEAVTGLKNKYKSKSLSSAKNMQESIYNQLRYHQPMIPHSEKEKFLKSLTLQDIQNSAQKYFQDKYLHELLMQDGTEVN